MRAWLPLLLRSVGLLSRVCAKTRSLFNELPCGNCFWDISHAFVGAEKPPSDVCSGLSSAQTLKAFFGSQCLRVAEVVSSCPVAVISDLTPSCKRAESEVNFAP